MFTFIETMTLSMDGVLGVYGKIYLLHNDAGLFPRTKFPSLSLLGEIGRNAFWGKTDFW